ncbi:MAG TPA: hypothetical protein VLD39_10795, partial [Gammaproteobacteria bacterium]|nr:hypothetical protein [Gammaproteobacteria bacterium]
DYGELQRSALFFKLRWAREIRDRLLAAIPERLQRAVAARLAGRSRSRIHSDISIDETPRSDAMAALVRRVAPDNAIGHVRDASYIRWRYDCPLSKYLFLSAGTATLDGFLVLQHRTERRHGTHIVDWEASSPEVFERLLSAAIVAAGVDDLKIWSACVPASLRRILDRHGFEPSGPRPGDSYRRAVLVKETAPAGSARGSADAPLGLALDAAWNLRMICSDDF